MAGSDAFLRSQRDQSRFPDEAAGPDTFVQIVIVYSGTSIKILRDGQPYADYEITQPQSFDAGSMVMFGKRHIDTPDHSRLRASQRIQQKCRYVESKNVPEHLIRNFEKINLPAQSETTAHLLV